MQSKNRSYFLECLKANHQTTLAGHLTSSFVGTLYPDSVAAGNISSEQSKEVGKTAFLSESVPIIKQDLKYVHPLVQNLFPQEQRTDLPVAGRLKHFHKN